MDEAANKVRVGIIGTGSISERYLVAMSQSPLVDVAGCAGRSSSKASCLANRFGIEAVALDSLLGDPSIDLVVNLTPPAVHMEISRQALQAGKHVYSEKPIAATFEDGAELLALSGQFGLCVGCAPDTFFGAAHQAARRAVDDGVIGSVVGGAIAFASRGMEDWHPNPSFFFRPGGGPLLDIGPYYLTQAINLLGPVRSVWAKGSIGYPQRVIGNGALAGQAIDVEVPTSVNGIITFCSGIDVPITASWDVWKHQRSPIEIYGTEGSLINPDPVHFDGEVLISRRDEGWSRLTCEGHQFSQKNHTTPAGRVVADYRGVGLLDMVEAIREGRAVRSSAALALHVLEVLQGLEQSNGTEIRMTTNCDRPAPL